MAIVPLTLTISLCLVFTFVIFFLREHARGRLSSAERDSLLPLAEENARVAQANRREAAVTAASRHHDEDHDHGPCGCQDGSRPPCAGCLRR
jgi:hypothetical protein